MLFPLMLSPNSARLINTFFLPQVVGSHPASPNAIAPIAMHMIIPLIFIGFIFEFIFVIYISVDACCYCRSLYFVVGH
jgi:hypothetical protein